MIMDTFLVQWFIRLSICESVYDQQGINYAFISDMSLDVADVTIHVTGHPIVKRMQKNLAFGYSGSEFDNGGVT